MRASAEFSQLLESHLLLKQLLKCQSSSSGLGLRNAGNRRAQLYRKWALSVLQKMSNCRVPNGWRGPLKSLNNILDLTSLNAEWPLTLKTLSSSSVLLGRSRGLNILLLHGLAAQLSSLGRLLSPRDSPGKNTGVGCHFLLQGNLPDPGIEPGSPGRFFFFPSVVNVSFFKKINLIGG